MRAQTQPRASRIAGGQTKSSKERDLQVIDTAHETHRSPSQSITVSLSGRNPPHKPHQRAPISDLTGGLFPCVITLKGEVTFFCRLMGFSIMGSSRGNKRDLSFHSLMELLLVSAREPGRLKNHCFHYSNGTGSDFRTWWQGRRGNDGSHLCESKNWNRMLN